MTGMVYSYRSQTKLREGNVFTRVCDSIHREGGLCPGGSLSSESLSREVSVQGGLCLGGSLLGGPPLPPYGYMWVVCILLECILVTGVCLFMGVSTGVSTHPLGELLPLPRYMGYYGIRSTSRRYAFYWNAFLFLLRKGLFFIHCMRMIMFFLAKFPLRIYVTLARK